MKPDDANPVVHARRASALAERGEIDAAIHEANRALELEPQFSFAHLLLAKLLSERALQHLQELQAPFDSSITAYTGSSEPVRVLQLGSARTVGLTNTDALLVPSLFETTTIIVQYWDPQRPLPRHDVILNAIADPDSSAGALDVASWVVAGSNAPIINAPDRIRESGRVSNARRFASIADVIAPAAELVPRRAVTPAEFAYPILLRSPGFHNGHHFALVHGRDELEDALEALPGDALLVMQFVDTRRADARFRKYRVMAIDGTLYPAHLAISRDWNVHYFSAQMGESERAEEAHFLSDMSAALGTRALRALHEVARVLNLDYAGIDFGIAPDGEVVVFEANASMTVFVPAAAPETEYCRNAAFRIFEAARELVIDRTLR